MKTIWVVGKFVLSTEIGAIWEIQGVFDSQQKAEMICEGHKNYFVGPLPVNAVAPHEKKEWPGVYYPKVKKEQGA